MTSLTSQINFAQAGLGEVLRQNLLMLPPNQREYAWEVRHVKQLFQDLSKAYVDGEAGYFLGTIVTIPRENGILEVVDGQQRLATTTILLATVRDYLQTQGGEELLIDSINSDFLFGIDRAKRMKVPRLRLNVDDHDLFGWLVSRQGQQPPVTKPSHRRLMDAYDVAAEHVKGIVANLEARHHGDELNRWVNFIQFRSLVVLVRVPDDANAYKMFETLNDRGLRTSQADLIKNYLFGRAGDRFQEVQTRWSYMRSSLESLADSDITVNFLRHALIVLRGYTTEAQVYEVVQKHAQSEQQAVTYATQLENLANVYVAISNPENELWNGYPDAVRRSIEVLNLLDIRPMRPLLMAVAAKFRVDEATRAFQFLVSFGVRLVVASNTRSGSIESAVAGAAHAVHSDQVKDTKALKIALAAVTPSNEEFRAAFAEARVSQAKFARYYLRSLELAASGEREPYFMPTADGSIINLEHVLPKKPMDQWSQFSPEEVTLWVNRLGNQVLMRASDNSRLKSEDFGAKKVVYAASPYKLTQQVAQADQWTPESIQRRQQALAEQAIKTWPV